MDALLFFSVLLVMMAFKGGGEVGKIRVGMGISTIKPLYYYFTKFNPFFS